MSDVCLCCFESARPDTVLLCWMDASGAFTMLRNVVVSGYFTGIVANEHTDGDGIVVAENVNGLQFVKANHASRFGRVGG